MALKSYGVLKGRPIARRLGAGTSPHYQVHLVADDDDYRIAVNVKSKKSPSELLYLIVENYAHPLVDGLKGLVAGFTPLESKPGGLALDYIRANLFAPDKMVPLPGTTIQLSNEGGIITLLNSEGLKVHGVQYNKNEVSEQGRTIVF